MDTTTASGGGSVAARLQDHQVDGVHDGCAQIMCEININVL